jgi:hypothetical protein
MQKPLSGSKYLPCVCALLWAWTRTQEARRSKPRPKVAGKRARGPQRAKSTLLSDNGKTTGTPSTGKTTALLQADVKTCNHNSMEQSKHREIQKIKNHLSHAQKNLIL